MKTYIAKYCAKYYEGKEKVYFVCNVLTSLRTFILIICCVAFNVGILDVLSCVKLELNFRVRERERNA